MSFWKSFFAGFVMRLVQFCSESSRLPNPLYGGTSICGRGTGSSFTSIVLPIATWLPGDIGDAGEYGELVLGTMSCS